MQTNAASMDPKIAGKHYIKLAHLWKMPDLARDVQEIIEQGPPPPDPRAEEILNNQLEESRLKLLKIQKEMEEIDSRIHERVSRSLENDTDIREKNSRAELQEEKAREIRAKTDLLDQQFLDKTTGADRKQKIQDEIIRDNAKKAAMEHKAIVDIQKKNIMDGNNSLNQENFQ